jgi:hypothetical protein
MKITPEHIERMRALTFAAVYPHYIHKIEKKGMSKEELDQVIERLTGYNAQDLQQLIDERASFETFFGRSSLNPLAKEIKGLICGYRIEEIDDELTRNVRYLDKLVDELAKGKALEKLMRKS